MGLFSESEYRLNPKRRATTGKHPDGIFELTILNFASFEGSVIHKE